MGVGWTARATNPGSVSDCLVAHLTSVLRKIPRTSSVDNKARQLEMHCKDAPLPIPTAIVGETHLILPKINGDPFKNHSWIRPCRRSSFSIILNTVSRERWQCSVGCSGTTGTREFDVCSNFLKRMASSPITHKCLCLELNQIHI